MDNRVTKKRVNEHLEYDWFKYVIILLVSILGGYFIFNQINTNRDYETVDIFVSCYASYTNQYESKTMQAMKDDMPTQYGENVIRQIGLNIQDPLSKDYATLFQTQGSVTSDILIIGESLLKNVGGYVKLTDELLVKYLLPTGVNIDDLEYYEFKNEKTDEVSRQGIRVDQFAKMSGKGGVFEMNWKNIDAYKDKEWGENNEPDSKFYLVLNPVSVSIGEYGKKGKPEHKQALFCVQKFIEFYRK